MHIRRKCARVAQGSPGAGGACMRVGRVNAHWAQACARGASAHVRLMYAHWARARACGGSVRVRHMAARAKQQLHAGI